jgi:hypothetical protein
MWVLVRNCLQFLLQAEFRLDICIHNVYNLLVGGHKVGVDVGVQSVLHLIYLGLWSSSNSRHTDSVLRMYDEKYLLIDELGLLFTKRVN